MTSDLTTTTATSRRRRVVCVLAALATGTAALVATVPVAAASASLVISEVYGGGGNSGAELTNDFVELRNVSSAPIALAGFSVQYAPAGATSWQVTQLTGTIPAGRSYLVGEAAGAPARWHCRPLTTSGRSR